MSEEVKVAPLGRPSEYNEETAISICERIAAGESLIRICDDEGLPHASTIYRWLAVHEDFRDKYAHARETLADTFFDQIIDIADDGTNDWMEKHGQEGENTGWRENGEAMRRSQLRIDARKWMAAKLKPKKYGDKLDVDHKGNVHVTIATEDAKLL